MNEPGLYTELLQQLETSWTGLEDKPDENPAITLRALWLAACGQPVSVQAAQASYLPLPRDVPGEILRGLVERRIAGEPLAYLTGRQNFMGIEMLAGPEAMIARRETELLGETALQALMVLARDRAAPQVADLCTGSGNLALALAFFVHSCQIMAADISEQAIRLARRNAEFLGLVERVTFASGDLFQPLEEGDLRGKLDLITCNPPYISSRRVDNLPVEIGRFEPRPAFDGGPFGVSVLTRLIREAPGFLAPGGFLAFEVGLGQGDTILRMVEKTGCYSSLQGFNNERGETRVILAHV